MEDFPVTGRFTTIEVPLIRLRSKGGQVTDTDKAVLSLKTQRRKLSAERSRVEGLVAKGVEEAREYIRSKRRERALLALRKNKLYEHNLDKIDAYLLNVEQILANIETAQRTNRLFTVLKEGNAAMTQLQQQVKLEDVERLNEETAEAKEYQNRVQELLSQSLSAQDDAEALEELEKIQAAQEAEEAAKQPSVPAAVQQKASQADEELPDVPTHEVKIPARTAQEAQLEGRRREEPLAA